MARKLKDILLELTKPTNLEAPCGIKVLRLFCKQENERKLKCVEELVEHYRDKVQHYIDKAQSYEGKDEKECIKYLRYSIRAADEGKEFCTQMIDLLEAIEFSEEDEDIESRDRPCSTETATPENATPTNDG